MKRKTVWGIALGLAVSCLALGGSLSAAQRTAPRSVGEVLIGGQVVMRFKAFYQGQSPYARAKQAAAQINKALDANATPEQLVTQKKGAGVNLAAGEKIIAQVGPPDAAAGQTSVSALAAVWQRNLAQALRDQARQASAREVVVGGPVDPDYYGWEEPKTKWVPIFSVENVGLHIGAAQVAGPAQQVSKVKGVAELQLTFKGFARIRAYVPVSSISVKLDRVQGVAVWATGDIKVLGS
jgi:hypothetical protein